MATGGTVLAELVRERGVALKRYAYLLCGDEAEAEDLLQEALLRAFSRRSSARAVDSAEAYVRKILLNAFLDQTRRHSRWRQLVPWLAAEGSAGSHADDVALRSDMLRALDVLTPRQRASVVLRFYEDLPVAVVADRLGCAEGTVKRHLHDAMTSLADVLGVRNGGDVDEPVR